MSKSVRVDMPPAARRAVEMGRMVSRVLVVDEVIVVVDVVCYVRVKLICRGSIFL